MSTVIACSKRLTLLEKAILSLQLQMLSRHGSELLLRKMLGTFDLLFMRKEGQQSGTKCVMFLGIASSQKPIPGFSLFVLLLPY